MKHVIIIDKHKIVREGIKAIINKKENLTVAGESGNHAEMLELCMKRAIDLAIIDPSKVDGNGIRVIGKFRQNYPDTKILVLTEASDRNLQDIIEADVDGYLLKDSGDKELLKAIEVIFKGEKFYSNGITRRVVNDYVKSQDKKNFRGDPNILTEREREILTYICKEYTNQEIAEKLSISVRTVDSHRRNLLQKTGARNTAGLVSFAIKHKLFQT